MRKRKVDRFFLIVVFLLLFLGVSIFISASLGKLVKDKSVFYSVLISQLGLGLLLGLLAMYFSSKIDYKIWRKYSFYVFLGTILLTLVVFIPGVGLTHGGATRWIRLGPLGTLQPAELLKFGFILYFAAWLSSAKDKIRHFKFGLMPLIIMLAVTGGVLLVQPDTKSFILIAFTGISMLFVAGVPWKHIIIAALVSITALGCLVYFTPYLQSRIKTFINPDHDTQGASYQINQSLIAIGSGGVFGRGYGQSIQKFSYLPEPHGDSIFAVLGEELGFIGAMFAVVLYLLFALRGLRISARSPDIFSRLLVFGIVILLVSQAFMNIAANIGLFPLTGVPLVFMSHGGTSLLITLFAVGIILQISKFRQSNT